MSQLRGRLDLLALGLSILVAFGLLAALAGRSFGRPLPISVSPLATPAPAVTPVATGWWDQVKLAPPALPAAQKTGRKESALPAARKTGRKKSVLPSRAL